MELANNINYYYNRVKNRWRDNQVEEKFVDFSKNDNDSESGNSNIVMQLRKIISLSRDGVIYFDDGSRNIVSVTEATIALRKLDQIPKPIFRLEMQNRLGRSPKEFNRVIS